MPKSQVNTWAAAFEGRDLSTGRSKLYVLGMIFVLLANYAVALRGIWSREHGHPERGLSDFDVFYLAGRIAQEGRIDEAYRWATFFPHQRAMYEAESFMPWTYPPQFNVLVEYISYVPAWMGFALFTGITMFTYLLIVKKLSGRYFFTIVLVMMPAFLISVACGQNGFLTGILIGLACLAIQNNRAAAGVPLGLMVIKPHLAVLYASYVTLTWRLRVVAVAAFVVLATSALVTWRYGPQVWVAFLAGLREAKIFLEHGAYPLYRMVSTYAAVRSLGAPANLALLTQIITAAIALAVACWPTRGRTLRQSLGLIGMASVLVSPYAYDYDLPIYGIGLALILPDLVRFGRPSERLMIYSLTWLGGGWGLAVTWLLRANAKWGLIETSAEPVTAAGIALLAALLVAWRVIGRASVSVAPSSLSVAAPSVAA